MFSQSILVLPGDGIGPEVIAEALKVLRVVEKSSRIQFCIEKDLFGGASIDTHGVAITESVLNKAKNADAVLAGAVGGPKWGCGKVRPEDGLLQLRHSLNAYANLRPCRFPSESLHHLSALKNSEKIAGVDFVLVRENCGGAYFGAKTETDDFASDSWEYSRAEVERISSVAIALAAAHDPPLPVISTDKANVLASSRLWRRVVTETFASKAPKIKLTHQLADSAAMLMMRYPLSFNGILLADNTFGDILSDEASVIPGSLGLLPSASLAGIPSSTGVRGFYEPVHGSAPDIAGKGTANPVATILSVAMMLRYSFCLIKEAKAVEDAVRKVLDDRDRGGLEIRTRDIGGTNSTEDVGNAVARALADILAVPIENPAPWAPGGSIPWNEQSLAENVHSTTAYKMHALGLNGLEHAQALLLVLLFSLQHDVGIGSKWDLARVAMRICIENRYHVKSRGIIQPMVDQMQRRVFWACYISDRHSSSMLGRPMAVQDKDIGAELPIDADDDLIESGQEELQVLRGTSEVSVQLRHIHLRKLTSRISTELYRNAPHCPYHELKPVTDKILLDLDRWRDEFPIVAEPGNAYETLHWRDLNFYRERLKCFRLLVLLDKENQAHDTNIATSLESCQQAAAQVATLYREMRASDKLVLNWTCVHDMMSAGFTMLYCGVAQQEAFRRGVFLAEVQGGRMSRIRNTAETIIDTLSHIAEKWATVDNHVRVFSTLASRVLDSMPPVLQTTHDLGPNVEPRADLDGGLGHGAEVWDAAMALLNEPLDLGNMDWGAINWDEVLLGSESQCESGLGNSAQ